MIISRRVFENINKSSQLRGLVSFRENFLELHVFCIGPSEIMELGRHIDSEIPPVPWLDLVCIDFFTFLVALVPPIEVSIFLHPGDVASVVKIFLIVICSCRIEYIDSETELMLTISCWRAECITAFPEIPHTLLICGTPVCTDHCEWYCEFLLECLCHIPERISSLTSESESAPTGCPDVCSTDVFEIIRCIFFICERTILAHESIDTCIIIEREGIIALVDVGIFFSGFERFSCI